jgi:acetyl esterase/lipase
VVRRHGRHGQQRSRWVAAALALVAGACMVPDPQPGQTLPSPQPNRTPAVANTDLAYGADPQQKLDIFRPPASFTGLRPLIVYVHGGAWALGDKADIRCGGTAPCDPARSTPALTRQIDRGYVFASINYRLLTETTRHPDQVRDVKLAVKWLRDHATTYDIDPNQVVLAGHSAGGHLAALAALTPGLWEPTGVAQTTVDGFMALNAPTDLKTWAPWGDEPGSGRPAWIGDLTAVLTNCDYTVNPSCTTAGGAYDLASPLWYASAGDPPGYLTCKDWDPFVSCEQLDVLHDKLITVQGGVEQAAVFDDVNCTDPARLVPCGSEPTEIERHNPDWDLNLVGLQDWLDQVTN